MPFALCPVPIRPLVLLCLLAACTQPSSDQATPVSGRTIAGAWTVAFTLDSQLVSANDDPVLRWRRADASAAVRGTIMAHPDAGASDTNGAQPTRMPVTMDVDFTPLFGRQMSCYNPGKRDVETEWDGDRVAIAFTPDVADCGFGAVGSWQQDTIRGAWSETSFVGPVAVGKFIMERR